MQPLTSSNDDGSVIITVRPPPEQGTRIIKAIEMAMTHQAVGAGHAREILIPKKLPR